MSKATNSIEIVVTVTLADDKEETFKVQISNELYYKNEIPLILEETLHRVSRAMGERLTGD